MSNLPKRFVAAPIAGLPRPEIHGCGSLFSTVLSQPKRPNVVDAGRIRFGAALRLPHGK